MGLDGLGILVSQVGFEYAIGAFLVAEVTFIDGFVVDNDHTLVDIILDHVFYYKIA